MTCKLSESANGHDNTGAADVTSARWAYGWRRREDMPVDGCRQHSAHEDGIGFELYDSFATCRFGGNVAGVVVSATTIAPCLMQQIARELGAPTTGFAHAGPREAGYHPVLHPAAGDRRLRPCHRRGRHGPGRTVDLADR